MLIFHIHPFLSPHATTGTRSKVLNILVMCGYRDHDCSELLDHDILLHSDAIIHLLTEAIIPLCKAFKNACEGIQRMVLYVALNPLKSCAVACSPPSKLPWRHRDGGDLKPGESLTQKNSFRESQPVQVFQERILY